MDDFVIGKQHSLPVTTYVNDYGRFSPECPVPDLVGKSVLTNGNDHVVEILKNANKIVAEHKYEHRYPYDWRTKKPIIVRATKQWFARLTNLKKEASDQMETVQFIPESGRTRLSSFVEKRDEWCISRQRLWGVPIPAFYKPNGEHVMDEELLQHVISKIEQHGSNIWWENPTELLPEKFKSQDLVAGRDTLDVWFDSGTTWYGAIIARGIKFPVDLYLEGSDQHRGWFQSSLLTSVAYTGKSPYKAVLTHGFVLDEMGRKMSKSIGNVIDPLTVINKYGADVLRLWVASSDFTNDVTIGPNLIGN
jgi:isoleucyl-tRNA synthetase